MKIKFKMLLLVLVLALNGLTGQTISPMLVGNNVWYNPDQTVWNLSEECGLQSVRIGGHEYDDNFPSNAQLLIWVNKIQAMGAEPIIQISQYGTAEKAAAVVKYFNIDSASGKPIKYWCIGNEPWLQANRPSTATFGAVVENYYKPIALAMKEVDSTIKIYGPDECDYIEDMYNDLFGGENDITGKIPGHTYYYCDGLSWHRYPQGSGDPATEGAADMLDRIKKAKTKVDFVNNLHNRTGDEALQWGIGEYNSKGGPEVHTWGNGQMFGAVLGGCMKYGATYATSWSMYEAGGSRQGSDFSFIDGTMKPRASYWHMQMIAKNFKGQYIDGTSSLEDIVVFGSKNADTVSVMIMNRKADNPVSYKLFLNLTDTAESGVYLNVNADSNFVYSDMIGSKTTQLLVIKNGVITKTNYSSVDFDNLTPPVTSTVQIAALIPSAPINLSTDSATYKSIRLSWDINAQDTISGFIIERKAVTDTVFKIVTIIGSSVKTFKDIGLNDSTGYIYRVQSYNNIGTSAYSNEVGDTTLSVPANIVVNGPHSIPGKIEVEDFDENDEGLSYHDYDPINKGGAYRTNQGVDIEVCTDAGTGYNIGYVEDGEWLDYTIENITPGTYDIAIRTASATTSTKSIKVYLSGILLGTATPKNTAGWQNWETIYISDVEITDESTQKLRLKMVGGSFNVNWIEFGENLAPSSLVDPISDKIYAYYDQNKQSIQVILGEEYPCINLKLIGIDGKVIVSKQVNNMSSVTLDAENLSNGVYLLNIDNGIDNKTCKILRF
jgi:hypothetical protein